jgi:hypothetical protein
MGDERFLCSMGRCLNRRISLLNFVFSLLNSLDYLWK